MLAPGVRGMLTILYQTLFILFPLALYGSSLSTIYEFSCILWLYYALHQYYMYVVFFGHLFFKCIGLLEKKL